MSVNGILNDIRSAVKGMTISDLGESVLQPAKRDQFIRIMQDRSVVLQLARLQLMQSNEEHIDQIWLDTLLTKGIDPDEVSIGTEANVKPDTNTLKLKANEMRGSIGLVDRAKRRNIERDQLEQTILDLAGNAAGRDMEYLALLGEKAKRANEGDDHVLVGLFDGWVTKAANKVTSVNADADDYPINLFEAMITEIDDKYILNPAEWRLFVPWSVKNDYANYLLGRETGVGDAALIGTAANTYKSFPIVVAPQLGNSTFYSPACLLAPPMNMVWGVFHQVTLEEDRKPSDRATDWYLTVEADAEYEDRAAACAAIIDVES